MFENFKKNDLDDYIIDDILYFPCNITSIGEETYLYKNKEKVKYVVFPEQVSQISALAFNNYSNL